MNFQFISIERRFMRLPLWTVRSPPVLKQKQERRDGLFVKPVHHFMKRFNVRYITRAALVAAIYAALTIALAPISYSSIQVRVAEAMCVLPIFMPEAIPGLFIGCVISNLVGSGLIDVVVGSLTTLLAAYLTYKLKDKKLYISLLQPVLLNAVFTGIVVHYLYVDSPTLATLPLTMLTVGVGEAIAVYGLGTALYFVLKRLPARIFEQTK